MANRRVPSDVAELPPAGQRGDFVEDSHPAQLLLRNLQQLLLCPSFQIGYLFPNLLGWDGVGI